MVTVPQGFQLVKYSNYCRWSISWAGRVLQWPLEGCMGYARYAREGVPSYCSRNGLRRSLMKHSYQQKALPVD